MVPTPRKRLCMAYVTVPSEKVGRLIADAAVSEKLAACAVLSGPSESVYRWKGKMEHATEHVLLLKTTEKMYPKLQKRIAAIHPYDVPCILKIPVTDAHEPFTKWLVSSVK